MCPTQHFGIQTVTTEGQGGEEHGERNEEEEKEEEKGEEKKKR